MKKLLAILIAISQPLHAACSNTSLGNGITCVQTATTAEGSSVTNQTSNTITSTTTGNALIALVGYTTTSGVTFACSSGMTTTGGTVTWSEGSHLLGTTFSEYICYGTGITGGTTAIKATVSGGTPTLLDVTPIELSGFASTPIDVTFTGTGGGAGSFTFGPSATSAQAKEYALCEMIMNGGVTTLSSPGGGFVIEQQQGSAHMQWLDQGVSATQTFTCSATMSASPTEWDGVIATFKASATVAGNGKVRKLEKLEES